MKMKLSVYPLLAALLIPLAALADVPGRHPPYLHVLTDLREARWNLEHRVGDPAARANEDLAVAEVDRAIEEIRRAAAEDGKNLNIHPHEDARLDRSGRLHNALELLRKARSDASREEDNPETRGLQRRALEHISAAIQANERAIYDLQRH